jgi:hypothetical protein
VRLINPLTFRNPLELCCSAVIQSCLRGSVSSANYSLMLVSSCCDVERKRASPHTRCPRTAATWSLLWSKLLATSSHLAFTCNVLFVYQRGGFGNQFSLQRRWASQLCSHEHPLYRELSCLLVKLDHKWVLAKMRHGGIGCTRTWLMPVFLGGVIINSALFNFQKGPSLNITFNGYATNMQSSQCLNRWAQKGK